ncbi:hypothetical protein LAZ67_1002618 [Cordylochernes scorpioides]|uniref:Uncharacterized protein n=1 Tax=Cordylochernes scorpioides TaxID=51811 RepID=A0ABY6JXT1_9ARAC|nr:hypothetical protein LAZ67_1002618 [Cordylochernes scorpioides]
MEGARDEKLLKYLLIDTSNLCCIEETMMSLRKMKIDASEDLDKLITDISNEDRVRLLDVLRRYTDVFEFQKANLKT